MRVLPGPQPLVPLPAQPKYTRLDHLQHPPNLLFRDAGASINCRHFCIMRRRCCRFENNGRDVAMHGKGGHQPERAGYRKNRQSIRLGSMGTHRPALGSDVGWWQVLAAGRERCSSGCCCDYSCWRSFSISKDCKCSKIKTDCKLNLDLRLQYNFCFTRQPICR